MLLPSLNKVVLLLLLLLQIQGSGAQATSSNHHVMSNAKRVDRSDDLTSAPKHIVAAARGLQISALHSRKIIFNIEAFKILTPLCYDSNTPKQHNSTKCSRHSAATQKPNGQIYQQSCSWEEHNNN